MTFICYVSCENGFRHFTCVNGVALSYDRNFIQWCIAGRKQHMANTEIEVEESKKKAAEQGITLDPRLAEHNERTMKELRAWTRRIISAEAVLNGDLIRSMQFVDKLEDAIAYSRGDVRPGAPLHPADSTGDLT